MTLTKEQTKEIEKLVAEKGKQDINDWAELHSAVQNEAGEWEV